MFDVIITLLIPIFIFLICFWNSKKQILTTTFFDKNYTNTLKGISSIIVILVHIPYSYQNPIQDMMGSFAFIAVTIFFMISSYGMEFCIEKKKNYLKTFWRNRLTSLLIPCFLINLTSIIYDIMHNHTFNLNILISLNQYIIVLLEFCLLFYIIKQLTPILNLKIFTSDILLICGILCSSLYLYFFCHSTENSAQMGWCYERYGLIWGILLYRYYNHIIKWLNKFQHLKIFLFIVSSMALGVLYIKFKYIYFGGEYLLKIILGLNLIILVFLLSQKRIFKNRVNVFLGKISYEIYLSHGLAMGITQNLIPNITSGLFILTTILITIVISSCIHTISNYLITRLRV